MKKICFILASIFVFSLKLNAEESYKPDSLKQMLTETPYENKELNELKDKELVKDRYNYFKLGTTALIQNVGVGKRIRNFEKSKGHDYSANIHVPLLGIGKNSQMLLPSFKYTYLMYKTKEIHSSYFGIGCELAAPIFFKKIKKSTYVVPNIELVWGKEREKYHFSQFGINLVGPAIGTTLAVLMAGTGHDSAILGVGVFAFISATSMSYTIGF